MKDRPDVDAAISAANPLRREAAENLSVERGEWELFAEIVEEPRATPEPATSRRRRGPFAMPGFGLPSLGRLALVAAASVALAIVGIVIASGGSPGGVGPTKAQGDGIQHLLEAFPPVVIDAPGWQVFEINEPFESEGYTEFDEAGPGDEYLELSWRTSESVEQLIQRQKGVITQKRIEETKELGIENPRRVLEEVAEERTIEELPEVRVLGTDARVLIKRAEGAPSEVVAVWRQSGRTYQAFESTRSLQSFLESLSRLRFVDQETWEKTLPGPVVKRGKGIESRAKGGK
jgi:hypothetical protein